MAVQGNLDPALCLATWEVAAAETRDVLDRAGTAPGHIFNLGHGVLPETDPAILEQVVDLVHAEGRAGVGAGRGRVERTGPVGVLVMAHGTPATPEGIAPFYTAIRRGSPPTPELLAELEGRYQAIGGTSPLPRGPGPRWTAWPPRSRPSTPATSWSGSGPSTSTPPSRTAWPSWSPPGSTGWSAIVLTPHQSSMGSGEYFRRAAAAAGRGRLRDPSPDPLWHRTPGLARLLAERVTAALGDLAAGPGADRGVLHRPQPPRSGSSPRATPTRARSPSRPPTSPRSPASTPAGAHVGWRGRARAARPTRGSGPTSSTRSGGWPAGARPAVLVCPVGFVSDHLEVLYDLDIEARPVAAALGMAFARTPSLNDDPASWPCWPTWSVRATDAADPDHRRPTDHPGVSDHRRADRPRRGRRRRRYRRPGRRVGAGPAERRRAPIPGSSSSRPRPAGGKLRPPSSPAARSTWPPTRSWPGGPRRPTSRELGLRRRARAGGRSRASI